MANEDRIQAMRQEFSELRQAIASDIDERLQAGELRLREGLSKDIDERFQTGERRLREGLSKDSDERFRASEQRLTENLTQVIVQQLETAQQHLDDRLQIHAEALKDVVTKAAEGYGGTLDGIQRELKDFRAEWQQKADDTDGALVPRLITEL